MVPTELRFMPPRARCHQGALPIVDAAGRPLTVDARVQPSRRSLMPGRGIVLFLFSYLDTESPDIEVQLDGGGIVCHHSHLTGDCWKFDTLEVCHGD